MERVVMKMFIVLASFAVLLLTNVAQAYPASDNVSVTFASGTRQFNTSRTDSTLGCFASSTNTCPLGSPRLGFYTNGKACCSYRSAESSAPVEQNNVAEAFDSNFAEAYWGYVSTIARSPNNGRTQSAPARLDACIGYGEVDGLGTGSSGWMNCYSKCDSSSNGYCNNSGVNDGSTVSSAACKDRCDCVITGFGTCENQ